MYTSHIGLKFLEIYNRKTNTDLSPASFFEEVMFPIFFEGEKHLMHVSNSPFFQNPAKKSLDESGITKSAYQHRNLQDKIALVSEGNEQADASIYVGYAANGPDQTTSGQVTSLSREVSSSEMYASWIGNALSVRVEGSQCLLIDSEPLLWHLYEGWEIYAQYIKPIKGNEGRQIETWNGYWLAQGDKTKASSPPLKGVRLDTYSWVGVIAGLLQWHVGAIMPLYIFSLGQTNTTYGFINLHLPQLKRLSEAHFAITQSLKSAELADEDFWYNYKTDFSLRDVCQMGEIGLRGLRPLDYGKMMFGNFTATKITDKTKDTFTNIKTWIIAMLNNKTQLQTLAIELATELQNAAMAGTGKDRGKNVETLVLPILESKGLKSFLEALSGFLDKHTSAAATCRLIVDESIRIPADQFPLFKALIRFEYTFLKK